MTDSCNQGQRREPGWISRDDRTAVGIPGSALRDDGTTVSVTISDVSRDGCRVDLESDDLRIGEWIKLETDGQDSMRGQVRWSLHGSAGVRFGASAR
ncbi:MAG: PilZ domain-containing protein [Sphingomicrobium sp.]